MKSFEKILWGITVLLAIVLDHDHDGSLLKLVVMFELVFELIEIRYEIKARNKEDKS